MKGSRATGPLRRPLAGDGQAYVEFAFVLPVLLVMALTATDLLRVASARGTAESTAATIAARSSMLVSKGDSSAIAEADPGAGITLACPASELDGSATTPTLESVGYAAYVPSGSSSFAYHTVLGDVDAPYRDGVVVVSVSADLDLESPVVAVASLVSGGSVPRHVHVESHQYTAHPDVTTPDDWGR